MVLYKRIILMLLEINFTLVLFAVSFLAFIYLLNLTLYKPVGNIVEKRKSLIDGDYERAKELSREANESMESYKNKIKSARLECQNIIHEITLEAQKQKEQKISALLQDLTIEKEEAVKKTEAEKNIVLGKIEKEIKSLSELIVNKILGVETEKTLAGTH